MATYEETFDRQIQRFKVLKDEKYQKIKELEELDEPWLTYYKQINLERQKIIDAFSAKAAELRSNPVYKQAQKIRSAYIKAKRAYESGENNEESNEKQSDYSMICENLKSFALSMEEEGNNLIHKMLVAWASTAQINETFYRKWQDILTYFKDFCSWWSNNIYDEKEKNNSMIIEQLWLKNVFNNIYHRCIMFSDKYKDSKIKGIQYFDFMVDIFKNIESTIDYSKDNWVCVEKEENDSLFS